jgi:hypothetical protein
MGCDNMTVMKITITPQKQLITMVLEINSLIGSRVAVVLERVFVAIMIMILS